MANGKSNWWVGLLLLPIFLWTLMTMIVVMRISGMVDRGEIQVQCK